MHKCPFVLYCDTEAILIPTPDENNTADVINVHVPSGICAITISVDPKYNSGPFIFQGKNCMSDFYDHLIREHRRIASILNKPLPLDALTVEEQAAFDDVQECPYCKGPFSSVNRKVRHHDHLLSSHMVSAACSSCVVAFRYVSVVVGIHIPRACCPCFVRELLPISPKATQTD